jgi:outer membrane protein insertion porin family
VENPAITTTPNTTTITPTSTVSPLFGNAAAQKYRESKVAPSFVHNTVDNPFTPRSGLKLTFATPVAGGPLGGTLDYVQPDVEAIAYVPHTKRTAFGFRAEAGWIYSYGDTAKIDPKTGYNSLPFYQRFALGGETQIRGYNVRSVGPEQAINGQLINIGGTKFLLFNAEYYIDIAGPLRGVLFYDAGQAFAEGQSFDLKRLRTSTGVELRFIMPVLNVPFRLIYAFNPNRDSFQPRSTFKFAVGTTF